MTRIKSRLENEKIWLTQQQWLNYIRHICDEQELNEISTCRNFRRRATTH